MKSIKLLFIVVAIAMSLAACGKPKNKITLEEAKGPGRDKELYRDAVTAIRKGNYDQGRILINTMINTYPESPLVKIAKLSNADSFYLQGGSKNLAQAEAAYREFVEFFPDDPLADDVMIKMAEIHLRQVEASDRDPTHAKLAERQLKETLRRYPNTDRKDQIEGLMTDVQEILAMHELQVARFNFKFRQAMAGAQLRTEEILNKYPNFSRFDEALWIHAQAMAAQEDTESASNDLNRLVTTFPKSDFADKAKEQLAKYGKAVPQADPTKASAEDSDKNDKGMVSKMTGFLFGPKIDTSNKGVIIDRSLKTDEIIARAQELAGPASAGGPVTPGATTTTNVNDSRPRRATGSASQDVEVKSGSPTQQTPASSSKKDKDKKKKEDDKKKQDNSSKVLRNP